MTKEMKVKKIEDTPFKPRMLFDEDRPGAVTIKEREDLPYLMMGRNTQRLWRIVKGSIVDENPSYLQDHGSSDEAVLFLVLSRYINDYLPYSDDVEEDE